MAKRETPPARYPPDPAVLAKALAGCGAGGPSDARTGRRAPLPPVDIDIRIARDGTWFYHGSPIARKPLVKLFSSVLARDADGEYHLVTPVEKRRIAVDDAPFVAVELSARGVGRNRSLTLRTNVDEWIVAGDSHPIRVAFDPRTAEPSPYVLVRDRLEALISRPVYHELADIGCEEEVGGDLLYGVWSEGSFFPLGRLDDGGRSGDGAADDA